DVYLGVDFWKGIGLLSKIMSGSSTSTIAELDVREDDDEESPKIHSLSEEQQAVLKGVINLIPFYEKEGLGRTDLIEHSIDVGNTVPIKQRHWPVPPAKENDMFAEVEHMLALGVIEESKSPWSSNCVLVKKRAKVRLCLDSREVNKCTRKDAYLLRHIDGILSRFPPARFITGLDMKHAFLQIPLE
ncbi:hypothetical protein KR093_010920, partial [Drosophila rubida]